MIAMLSELETGARYCMPPDKMAPAARESGMLEIDRLSLIADAAYLILAILCCLESSKPADGATLEVIDEEEEQKSQALPRGKVEPNEVEAEIMKGHREVASATPAVAAAAGAPAVAAATVAKVAEPPVAVSAQAADSPAPVDYTVTLLYGDLQSQLSKARFAGFFHRVVLGSTAPTKVSPELNAVFATPCVVTLDSAKCVWVCTPCP